MLRRTRAKGETMSEISNPDPSTPGGLRIGTLEREQAATALAAHFAAGRLDTDEFDARVRQAYLAKTAADLAPLFADLPGEQRFGTEVEYEPEPSRRDPGREAAALRTLLFVIAVLAAVLWVLVVRVPPLVFLPIIWLVLARHHLGRRSCRAW